MVPTNGPATEWLFGFSKNATTITPADKEFEFPTRIGTFLVKTKFNLKEMIYRGELAL